jgi:tetratricopeptide (TPR) repeat protein
MKLGALLLFGAILCAASRPEVEQARKLYNSTDFDQSLKVLHGAQQKDAEVWELIGRNHYMMGDYKRASESLEKAAAADPSNSSIALWLGRAFGRRAETSSFVTAPGFASRARQWFEKSVELNPKNLEAMSDLLEYYLEAPGFLGGGFDKAAAVAQKMSQIDAAEGYWAKSKLAEKRKEFRSAEEQLKRALDASPHAVGRVLDLARFLARQGRFQEANQTFAKAEKLGQNDPKVIYTKAELLIQQKQNLQVAKDLLKRYITMKLTPDDPSRAEAQKLLKQAEGS